MNEQQTEIFTDKEAADFLRMSVVTLWRERRAGRITYRRAGGKLLYTRGDLEQYLEHVKRPATALVA